MKTEVFFLEGLDTDITFYIGQNKNENFDVIDKGRPDDLWFHAAQGVSSCHVVAIVPNDISNKDKRYIIKAGALLCKKYTNKLACINGVEICYTEIINIQKTKTPGCVKIISQKTIKV
jgi:predicted ribosome quality control (RQC) complex YloA/Tae2 family protein